MRTEIELIKSFNKVIVDNSKPLQDNDKKELIKEALQKGYILHNDILNSSTKNFINSIKINYNSTFYTSLQDVISKDRLELFIDQVIHYATTYGTNYSMGNGYVPNTPTEDIFDGDITQYTVLLPCTEDEMYELCYNLLNSNIGISHYTLRYIIGYVLDYTQKYNIEVTVDYIEALQNKEAKIFLYNHFNLMPNAPFDLLRYILIKSTGNPMIIKDKETISRIKYGIYNQIDLSIYNLSDNQLKGLASIFYRFKPLFLALKQNCEKNANIINKIRRMAKKYHKPLETNLSNSLLSKEYDRETYIDVIKNTSVFKLISICNAILYRLNKTTDNSIYIIRNGKLFNKETSVKNYEHLFDYYKRLLEDITDYIKMKLSEKYDYVRLPENEIITYACPTSEKNFIGNIPVGSYFDLSSNNYLGIYWRNEWGTYDFDLSILTPEQKFGWNAGYYNEEKSIIFSGDMTSANPEASEILYIKKEDSLNGVNGLVKVNRFNGAKGSKFVFFVGKNDRLFKDFKDKRTLSKKILTSSDVFINNECISENKETTVGIITNKKMFFGNLITGDSNVSLVLNREKFGPYYDFIENRLYINDIIERLPILEDNTEDITPETKILDLSNITKETFIEMLKF